MKWKDREYRMKMLNRISICVSLTSLVISVVALILKLAR